MRERIFFPQFVDEDVFSQCIWVVGVRHLEVVRALTFTHVFDTDHGVPDRVACPQVPRRLWSTRGCSRGRGCRSSPLSAPRSTPSCRFDFAVHQARPLQLRMEQRGGDPDVRRGSSAPPTRRNHRWTLTSLTAVRCGATSWTKLPGWILSAIDSSCSARAREDHAGGHVRRTFRNRSNIRFRARQIFRLFDPKCIRCGKVLPTRPPEVQGKKAFEVAPSALTRH